MQPSLDRFPDGPFDDAAVLAEVAEFREADHAYADGGVANSICTAPLPLARRVFAESMEANLGDPRIFAGARRVEATISRMLGDLLGCSEATGMMTSGGTEANLSALLAAVELHSRRRGLSRCEVSLLATDGAHFSFDKIARLLGVRLVRVRLDNDFRVSSDDILRRVDATTAAAVLTAGTSECGAVDDIAALAPALAARNVPVHVDAAMGGFLLPFLPCAPAFDFRVAGVTSIAIDPHKYGRAAIPAGWLLFGRADHAQTLRTASHYVGTSDHTTLLGTRPGAAVYGVYAALRALGRSGFEATARSLVARRDHLIAALRDAGFTLAFQPDTTIVGVTLADPEGAVEALEQSGIIASVSRRHRFLRIVIQHHLDFAHLDRLVGALVDFETRRRLRCAS